MILTSCCSGLVLVGISSCSWLCGAKVSAAPGSVRSCFIDQTGFIV